MIRKFSILFVIISVNLFSLCSFVNPENNKHLDAEITENMKIVEELLQEKKYKDIIEILNRLLEKQEKIGDKRFYRVYERKVKTLQLMDRFDEALQVLNKMKKEYFSESYLVNIYFLEGDTYLLGKEYKKATETYGYVIKHAQDPGIIEISKMWLSICLTQLGEFQEAIKIRESMEKPKSLGLLYTLLADSYIKQGKEEEAMKILKDASKKLSGEDKKGIDLKIVWLLQMQGKNKELVEFLATYKAELPQEQQQEHKKLLEKIKKMEGYEKPK